MAHVGAPWRFRQRLLGCLREQWKCAAPIAHLGVCTLATAGTQSDAQGQMPLASPRAALALKRIDASTERRRGLFGREVETCSAGYLARKLSCSLIAGTVVLRFSR